MFVDKLFDRQHEKPPALAIQPPDDHQQPAIICRVECNNTLSSGSSEKSHIIPNLRWMRQRRVPVAVTLVE